ncbi:hypothetical protein [Desulfobotulus sp.]|jgi:hypothetical protein|uniref:hypothetical protein n=1 Tax=Desulfobotulus sp. TaxID=1940337 RepID=UPI002A360F98|nr:hypothetical protein [Desulfobotulus sp.]MDY0161706.1 hypothetical protein [Desulfobotulus sp.]
MSELHIALVAEGPTDKEIIEAALGAVLEKSRPFILTLIPPEPTRPSFGGGWGGVLKWCHDTRLRHTETLDDDPTLSLFDLVIIHLDVDVATFRYADCGPEVMDLARQMVWHPLPCNQPCPPCSQHRGAA